MLSIYLILITSQSSRVLKLGLSTLGEMSM